MKTKKTKTYICTLSRGMFEVREYDNGDFVSKSDYDKLLSHTEKLIDAGKDMADVINKYRLTTCHSTAIDKVGGFWSRYRWNETVSEFTESNNQ